MYAMVKKLFVSGRSMLMQTIDHWLDDYAPSMGAALAYYTMFSIAPLLLIVISVTGLIIGEDTAREAILTQINTLMGAQGATAVEALLNNVQQPERSAWATAIGIGTVVVGATTVFAELQGALDRIWKLPKARDSGGIVKVLLTRILSFGMILGIGFLLIVSLVLSAVLSALSQWWSPLFVSIGMVTSTVDIVISFILLTLAFAMIYKFLPRVRIGWRDVWIGAAVTAFLFSIGKNLIGIYLTTSAVSSAFGAAASLVVMVVWVYYSAQIFLFGAEFTRVYTYNYGSRRAEKDILCESARAELPEEYLQTADASEDTLNAQRPALLRPIRS